MPADTLSRDIIRICEEATKPGDLDPADIVTLAEHALAEPARIASARQEGYREGVADAKQAAGCAAWRHEGDDARSRGMDAGARRQVSECVKAIAALSPLPAEPTDGWIEWKGGECSLPDGLEIDVKYGDGRIYRTSHPDGVAGWAWAVRDILAWARIIAYRIVKPAEPSAPVAEDE